MGEAQQKVAQAMQSTSDPRGTNLPCASLGRAQVAWRRSFHIDTIRPGEAYFNKTL